MLTVDTECDRLTGGSRGAIEVDSLKIDAGPAVVACRDAMRRYPGTARFIYLAGRVADSQKDYTRAAEFYQAAIAKGSVPALTGLGYLHEKGHGVTRDYFDASQWYEKAAALDDAEAASSLGRLYLLVDYEAARSWFKRAADLSHAAAMYNLGIMYHEGLGVPRNYPEARIWYEKAASRRNTAAMLRLGVLYEADSRTGNRAQARYWYQKAAEAGNEEAKEKLKNFR